MGADGGTVPTRDEMVRVKEKAKKIDPRIGLNARWQFCAISSERLKQPIVACEYGFLFNKQALLEHILRAKAGEIEKAPATKHIKGLKDVHELNLTVDREAASPDSDQQTYSCPVTGLPMNGLHRFVYPVTCGCVVSERALREVKTSNCHKCGKPFKDEDLVTINPDAEELQEMRRRVKERRAAAKADKKKNGDTKTKTKAAKSSEDGTGKRKATSQSTPGSILKRAAIDLGDDPQLKWALSSNSTIDDNPNASAALKSLFRGRASSKS